MKNRQHHRWVTLSLTLIIIALIMGCAKKPYKKKEPIMKSMDKGLDTIPVDPYTTKYFSSPPAAFRPFSISQEEAEAQVENKREVVGFERTYFSAEILMNLVSQTGAVGLRVYTASETGTGTVGSLLMIAVDNARNEIYSAGSSEYYYSEGINAGGNPSFTQLDSTEAAAYVTNSKTKFGQAFAVYFDASSVESALAPGRDGVNFLVGEVEMEVEASGSITVESKYTLTMVPADISGSSSEDYNIPAGGENYIESKMPCPPDCGSVGKYLIPLP